MKIKETKNVKEVHLNGKETYIFATKEGAMINATFSEFMALICQLLNSVYNDASIKNELVKDFLKNEFPKYIKELAKNDYEPLCTDK